MICKCFQPTNKYYRMTQRQPQANEHTDTGTHHKQLCQTVNKHLNSLLNGTKELADTASLRLQVVANHLRHVASLASRFLVSREPLIGTVTSNLQLLGQHVDEGRIWNPPIMESPMTLNVFHKHGPSSGDCDGGWNSICS